MTSTNESAWADLRALRADRPGYAAQNNERRNVFLAAMEQSEQMLRGAARLGYASRPLNLFYGLSQAGRALTAAWTPPEWGDLRAWRLTGHGVTAKGLGGSIDKITVYNTAAVAKTAEEHAERTDKPRQAFTAVAETLDSGSLEQPALLTDLWAYLPEAAARPAPGDDERWGPLRRELAFTIDDNSRGQLVTVWMHNWPPAVLDDWRERGMELNDLVAANLRARYHPAFMPFIGDHLTVPLTSDYFGQRGSIRVSFQVSDQPEDADFLRWALAMIGERYRGTHYLFPVINGADLHPFVTWWAVLYALSMLARYEPQAWFDHINVNASPWAVPLESLLDSAVEAVPEVIAAALSTPPRLDAWDLVK